MERARTRAGRLRPENSLRNWSALVQFRWTLVDDFDVDGRRYVLARKNDPPAGSSLALSQRERQVVAFVRLGHPNKLIAYELGITASTVGVLLHRAMRKLGVGSRRELVERPGPEAGRS